MRIVDCPECDRKPPEKNSKAFTNGEVYATDIGKCYSKGCHQKKDHEGRCDCPCPCHTDSSLRHTVQAAEQCDYCDTYIKALKEITKVTYGSELSMSEEEWARYFSDRWANQCRVARKALHEVDVAKCGAHCLCTICHPDYPAGRYPAEARP